jgi:hypothetical protein
MAYKSIFGGSSSQDNGGYKSIFGSKTKTATSSTNLKDIENLKAFAASKGMEVKEKKPSFFVRAIDFISRPTYASAGAAKAIVKNFDADPRNNENPLFEAWKGLKGEEKETYSDVLKQAGVKNKIATGLIGFALDVALDPTTYIGGSLVKGTLKGTGTVAKGGLNLTRKFNPKLAEGIEVAGKTLKDAFGNAFVHGYGATEGVVSGVSKYYNKLGMATDETIGKLDDAFKQLPKEQHTEFAKTLLEHRKGLAKLAKDTGNKILKRDTIPTFKTKEQLDFFNNNYKKIVDEMAESAGLPLAKRFKAYFPSIDVERLKPTLGGRAVSVTDESYKKLYQGLVEKELDKPVEALARTQVKIIRDNLSRSVLDDAVKTYGVTKEAFKQLPKEQQALYKLIKEKQFGKEVGYLKEGDFNFINNYLYPELKSIDMLAKASGYDAFTKFFKGAVTSWFPAFHARNAMSGVIQNYEVFGARAFDPSNIASGLAVMKGADRNMKLGGKIYKASDLQRILKENFGGSSRYVADLGDYIQELTDGSYKVLKTLDPRKLGNFIEMNQKANALVIGLKQGKTIPQAIKLAESAGFNYQNITKFESKVMRRLIPFYTFARKNAELQGKTLISHPERILNQAKAANMIGNLFGQKMTEDDMKGVPPWALQGLGFKIQDNKYVSQFGLPIEEFLNRVNNPLMSTLTSLNPIIKYPVESKMGYDFFRNSKIVDVNTVAKGTGEILWQAQQSGKLPKEISQAINIKKFKDPTTGKEKYSMSPTALHLMRNLPTSRFENVFNKIFDKDLSAVEKYVAFFSGGKIYEIDTEKQKYFIERDLRRDMEDWLLGIGEGKKFEQFYIPKREEIKE